MRLARWCSVPGIVELSRQVRGDRCDAATEVNRAIFFSAAIIIAGFVPLFTMSGIEGHIFGPMAKTYAYAIAGGLHRHLHRHAGA